MALLSKDNPTWCMVSIVHIWDTHKGDQSTVAQDNGCTKMGLCMATINASIIIVYQVIVYSTTEKLPHKPLE